MNIANNGRLCDAQQVVVALDITMPVGKALAAKILFFQLVSLNHGSHGAIEQQNARLSSAYESFKTGMAFQGLGSCIEWHMGFWPCIFSMYQNILMDAT